MRFATANVVAPYCRVKYRVPADLTNCARAAIRTAVLSLLPLVLPCLVSAGIWLSSINGSSVNEEGKPLARAVLRFIDPANGRHFEITTDAEGHFTYIAVQPSHYRLEILRARHQPVIFPEIYLDWSARPLLVDIDLRKHSAQVTRQVILAETYGSELSAPSLPVSDPHTDEATRQINEKLAAASRFMEDLAWAWLANIYCEEARHELEHSATTLENCVRNYQTAIAISPQATYFNNLGAAYSLLNDWPAAADQFRSALKVSPDRVALYHLNLGSALLKQSEVQASSGASELLQSAAQEFATAANSTPPLSESYYWKGLCELRLSGMQVPGFTFAQARDSFALYLQLVPAGPYASDSRAMLEGLAAPQAGADSVPKP